jgi:glycosyltransferase involved in cell wall biosynthesis
MVKSKLRIAGTNGNITHKNTGRLTRRFNLALTGYRYRQGFFARDKLLMPKPFNYSPVASPGEGRKHFQKAIPPHFRDKCRAVLLINFIAPNHLSLLKALASRVNKFTIFISTKMEPNRFWKPQWDDLSVVCQKSITLHGLAHHPAGFTDPAYIHIPYDTLAHLRRMQPDVVISIEFGFRTLQALCYRFLHPSSRLIVWAALSERSEQGRGIIRKTIRGFILRHADGVFVNGKSGARYIHRFHFPEKNTFTIPYSTDNRSFGIVAPRRQAKDAYRLLYVGQLIDRKGILPFLEVLSQWAGARPKRKIDLWIVGEGPLRRPLESFSLPDNFTMSILGNIDYPALPGIYAKAGILVIPSLVDEWGIVVNEAMMTGMPILGSRYSQAVEELVKESSTGWCFYPDHPEEVMLALDRAFSTTPTVLKTMRLRAREAALKFKSDTIAERIASAIDWVGKS